MQQRKTYRTHRSLPRGSSGSVTAKTSNAASLAARSLSDRHPGADVKAGKKRTLLLGLGNDIMGDDAVGLLVARELRHRLGDEIDVLEAPIAGFALLDLLRGYDRALVVDSVCTSESSAGSVREFSPDDFQQRVSFSPHYVGLNDVLELAKKLEIPLPSEIRIVAVEINDPFTVREGLSPEINSQFPRLMDAVVHVLRSWGFALQKPAAQS